MYNRLMHARVYSFCMALIVTLAFLLFPSTEVSAKSRYSQLAVYKQLCSTYSNGVDEDTNCSKALRIDIIRVVGYNQNGDKVEWRVEEHPCEEDGNNSYFIRGWWWMFDHPEGVQVTLSDGITYTIKTSRPVNRYWAFVKVQYNYWNNIQQNTNISVDGIDNF